MDWKTMQWLEPELARLKQAARTAGANGASWDDFIDASHEALSKAVGRGAALEELQSAACYERARAGLFAAWSRGVKETEAVNAPTCCLRT